MTEHNARDGRLWLHGDLHLTPGNLFYQFLRVKRAVSALQASCHDAYASCT